MNARTTVTFDIVLLDTARKYTGIKSTSALMRAGLQALIAQEAGKRLAALGGFAPNFRAGRRRRSKPSR